MSEEEQDVVDVDLFEEGLNEKIESYFSSNNNELLSYDKIDEFLQAIELYDMWNSEEEKDILWQCLMKYSKDDKIDKEGTIKGMHDLLTQEEENQKDNKEDNLLTRISRMSYKNDGTGTVNKLVLNKYKQRAIDEYDCLDNQTLIQFKKIFVLLNINENNKTINPEKIEEICGKHKFIKLDKNEIVKYLSFLTCEDKPIEEIKSLNINIDIFYEIDSLLQDKLMDEDLDAVEENEEDEEGDKKDDPLEILEDIFQKIEITKDNIIVLKDMKNNLLKLNENMCENINKAVQENTDENQTENISRIEGLQTMINEKIEKFDDFLQNLNTDQKTYIKKISNLKKSIIAYINDMNTLKEDYKILYEKYNNNQELEVDEEMERLLDENVALNQELNAKKEELRDLLDERAQRDNQINELYVRIEEDQKIEKELRKQIAELKITTNKQKEEYENLMDSVVNKIEKKENEEKRERQKIKEMLEKQLKTEEDKKNENDKNKNEQSLLQIKELSNIDNLNIPLTEKLLRKKKILAQLSNEQLMEYTLKLERLNISLKSEKNKKETNIKEQDEKIAQLNGIISKNKKEIGSLKIEIKKLQKLISDLQNEVKSNEIFRPSIAMNGNMRISRMSKLNKEGVNQMKFGGGFKNVNKNLMNSLDFFKNDKNMSFNVNGKKNITSKLKYKNINQQIGKEQKTKFAPENILNTIYGNEENKIAEEQNEEEKEQNEESKNQKEKKKDFEIAKNAESQIEGHKMPFTNLEQNFIEFDIQNNVNNIGENEVITIDNINDINLGGSSKEMIEINKEENKDNTDKIQNDQISSQYQANELFFESKPLDNAFEKKENAINELYDDDNDRETIHMNQNVIGGLEDMMFGGLEKNDELNTGRESDTNSNKRNDMQMAQFGLDIENEKNDENNHNDRLKSSDNIIYTFNSKDKLNDLEKNNENNIIIEGNNNNIIIDNEKDKKEEKKEEDKKEEEKKEEDKKEEDKKEEDKKDDENINKNEILEINNNNQINIKNEEKEKNKNFSAINSDWVNIDSEKVKDKSDKDEKDNQMNRKRTIVDVGPNNLSANKVLGISHEDTQEIKGRENRIKTLKTINNSSNTYIGKKFGFVNPKDQEIENNNYDYYSLYHEDYVKAKLRAEKDNGNEKNIYSDQIYSLGDKKKLEKRLILLTPNKVYIIEEKNSIFDTTLDKSQIDKIVISNQNLSILAFLTKNGKNDILLLTLRRMDLLYYLRDHYRISDKPLRFEYKDNFLIKINKKDFNISVKEKNFTTLSNFDGAIKIGYLQKLDSRLFKIFNQRLVVLTSIGLIVFDDPKKPPERLYPIIGSKISKASYEKYKKSNVFEIKTPAGETKVFAAYKEREMNSWIEEFEKVKEDFKKKMKKLDTTNKIEFINNNNTLCNVKEEENEEEILPNSIKGK